MKERIKYRFAQFRYKFAQFRYKLAYFIAPDWIDDLEYRLGAFLCSQTGGRLSKSNYSLRTMEQAAQDYQMEVCDECEYYKECCHTAMITGVEWNKENIFRGQ